MIRSLPVRLGEAAVRAPKRALLVAALILLAAVPGILRVQVVGDPYRLIPQRSEASKGLALALEGLSRSDAVFALVEGPAEGPLLLEFGEQFAADLRQQPLVEAAETKPAEGLPDLDPLTAIDTADATALDELAARFSPEGTQQRARVLKELLSGPSGADARRWATTDPFGLLEVLGHRVARGVQRVHNSEHAFLAPDGRALLVVVRPSYTDTGSDFHQELYEQLRGSADRALAAHPRGHELTVGFTGSFIYTREIAAATRSDASTLSTTAMLAVIALYYAFYRSIVSLIMVVALLPISAIVTLGFGGYAFGELTPLAAGFASVVFGVGVDPAIHLLSRYREERVRFKPIEAALAAVRGVAVPVVLSSSTTAAALFSMSVFDPKAMGPMGVLAGVGVLLNALLMLLVLPASWALLGERIGPDPGLGAGLFAGIARFALRRYKAIAFATLGVLALGVLAWKPLHFEASMRAFQPETMEPVRIDRAIERHFGDEQNKLLVLVRGADEEAVRRASDQWEGALDGLVRDGKIGSYESASVLMTARATGLERRKAASARLDLPGAAESMRQALVGQGFRVEPFEPALTALAALGTAADPGPRPPTTATGWVEWFERKHISRLDGDVRIATRVLAAGRSPVEVAAALEAAKPPDLDGVSTYVTGVPLVEAENVDRFEKFLVPMVMLGGLGLGLMLFTHYRRVRIAIVGLLPLLAALGGFLCVYADFGIPLTIFALASLPLLIGIGIDDHLFVLDRYLEDGEGNGDLVKTLVGTGRAVLVCTLTTVAAFGVLAMSRFEALAALGRAVTLGLTLDFITSTLVLPALIAWWLPRRKAPGAPSEP